MSLKETFLYWIQERESIRKKKEAGLPKPWTTDPIFQQYKFCNVERENDRVTKWIKDNWREPYRGHPNMWFAMVVARLFNWPDTLEKLTFPQLSFPELKEKWRHNLKGIRDDQGAKVFTGAYLVSTNGIAMDKIDYILDRVLTPIWNTGRSPIPSSIVIDNQRPDNVVINGDTLQSYWKHLITFDGLGSFMAGQVIADLKYVDPVLENAPDWWTWAPLGPGSKRGLNRVFERPLEKRISQAQAEKEFLELQALVEKELNWRLPVHDIQNCLCETDKYIRVKNGEGKPRSGYKGV